jgi:crossover junction endodeoxyribonuclease RuvC
MGKKIRILGVDPGSVFCGYGVIEKDGEKLNIVEYGVIRAKKKHDELNLRLKEIFLRLDKVISRSKPDEAAFESIFYAKNVQSLLKLTHARAVAILAAVLKDIPVYEYSAKEVKKSVTGRGAANKGQVQFMTKKILSFKETPDLFDVTDALAVAVCHALRRNMPKNSAKSWNDFVKNNPGRIIGIE